jgi:hypothetical protein
MDSSPFLHMSRQSLSCSTSSNSSDGDDDNQTDTRSSGGSEGLLTPAPSGHLQIEELGLVACQLGNCYLQDVTEVNAAAAFSALAIRDAVPPEELCGSRGDLASSSSLPAATFEQWDGAGCSDTEPVPELEDSPVMGLMALPEATTRSRSPSPAFSDTILAYALMPPPRTRLGTPAPWKRPRLQ